MKLISDIQQSQELLTRVPPPEKLRFVADTVPGIARQKEKDEFVYFSPDGNRIDSEDELARINSLGIPPAWSDVWICTDPTGYLQATGIDAAQRKQYRYHTAWRAYRERTKFRHLVRFGVRLPRIRRRIRRAFRNSKFADRELVTAALVRLLDDAPLRIGAADNDQNAVGASTLKRRNISMSDDTIRLDYTAKGGKRVRRQIKDARLLSVLDTIDDLPGRTVFQYVGDDEEVYPLRSEQVNEWLKAVTDDSNVSAKMFRTWSGSLAAFTEAVSEETITIKAMSEAASKRLRNTPAVARRSYIHPAIIALNEATFDERKGLLSRLDNSARDLTRVETAMLRYLADAEKCSSD
ncbi:DNA topoisomerase IB [Erythrobacter sp. YT30]|uniref:DNA topoisomerase IB n=1 Tax=Erythrobacter sp. YT30 TaxID=1735012 RepID=UPI00076D2AD6|nr:DNA topoisomerase IB [Erythrobacter sp. YT30]KWV92720.1 hypothetical protein AUC45_00665 [Erythrobacter sp. YT30]